MIYFSDERDHLCKYSGGKLQRLQVSLDYLQKPAILRGSIYVQQEQVMPVDQSQPAAARRIQQREIAERAGVSVSTVSRVLNNVAGISESVQQRVLAAAAELGYEKNEARPASRIQNVSLLTSLPLAPSIDPFHADVLSGVELACGR
ncbi:MAG TPA: LacI family DNA-binding transcriptional regulator, partial [Roseiflexaceae bacterium]|nr:LacI family DNA-binding transcriptional regulator [Roseiflexaceae bacterium]